MRWRISIYAEVLESTQLALIATVHKLYAMVRHGQQWDLAEPELNGRGHPIIHNIATLLGSIRSNADADLPPHTVFPEDEGGLAKLAAELELPQQDSNMVPIKLETDSACSRTERARSSELDHSGSEQDYRNTVMSSQNVQPDYPESFTSYKDFYTNTVPTEMDPSAMFPVQTNTNPGAVPLWKMALSTQWALLPNSFMQQMDSNMANTMLSQGLVESEFGTIKPHILNCHNPEVMLGVGDPMIYRVQQRSITHMEKLDDYEHPINKTGGSIAFVDDYTAWVAGPTAQANDAGIRAIIYRALDWEGRSGATFEAEKTAIIHFSRKAARVNNNPFLIKGERHIARVSSRALEAAIELERLKGLPPATARQLFTAMVALILDYASNVWRFACDDRLMHLVNRIQKVGAQATVSAFNKVAEEVAEAEAHILPARSRFAKRAIKLWVDIHTLPSSNPLRTAGFRMFTRFISPMQQLAEDMSEVPISRLETIDAYAAEPWNERVERATGNPYRYQQLSQE
ncbi:hypothetical protein TruAng_011991 [Truncatella angustata]|nr:hypothetical protein TruAng_011991 [Truncatella angustata]